jgi:hypothetical protein
MPSKEVLDVLDAIKAWSIAHYGETQKDCYDNAFGPDANLPAGRFSRGRIYQARATQVELEMLIGKLRRSKDVS